jgi:hypothetical protein
MVWFYEEASFGSGRNTQNGWVKRTPALTDARAPITGNYLLMSILKTPPKLKLKINFKTLSLLPSL